MLTERLLLFNMLKEKAKTSYHFEKLLEWVTKEWVQQSGNITNARRDMLIRICYKFPDTSILFKVILLDYFSSLSLNTR